VTRSPVVFLQRMGPARGGRLSAPRGRDDPFRHSRSASTSPEAGGIYKLVAGLPYPKFVVRPAQRELDEFIHISRRKASPCAGRR